VACVNSPDSVVLASSEARLNEVKQLFPEGTATTFVQGNIAFHSSRMVPILETMKARLGFLDARGPTGWSLPFVSTVTGKVETGVDAEYWIKNVRYPVLFQKAIETLYAGDTVPDVVLEIGPHQTLVSPIKQVRLHGGIDGAIGQPPTPTCPAPC
jgi:acyl transferase domain-containing protein